MLVFALADTMDGLIGCLVGLDECRGVSLLKLLVLSVAKIIKE